MNNGDTYKRIEIAPGVYQCGCKWVRKRHIVGRGDVLVQCPLHQRHTEVSVARFELEKIRR